jgi:hypothetical protein
MENSVFVIENERRKTIEEYNKRHLVELEKNYFVQENDINVNILMEREQIANKIRKNFDNLSKDELIKFSNICSSEKEHKSKLLAYELKYYREKTRSMTLDQFKDKAIKILTRYQSKAGGFKLEDLDWSIYTIDNSDEEHTIMENELLFENTMCKCDEDDSETNKYLTLIVDQLKSLSDDIEIELRFNYEDNLIWVWIWITYLKKTS